VQALKLQAEREHATFEEEFRQLTQIIEDDRRWGGQRGVVGNIGRRRAVGSVPVHQLGHARLCVHSSRSEPEARAKVLTCQHPPALEQSRRRHSGAPQSRAAARSRATARRTQCRRRALPPPFTAPTLEPSPRRRRQRDVARAEEMAERERRTQELLRSTDASAAAKRKSARAAWNVGLNKVRRDTAGAAATADDPWAAGDAMRAARQQALHQPNANASHRRATMSACALCAGSCHAARWRVRVEAPLRLLRVEPS
jgi:hypothetical protein